MIGYLVNKKTDQIKFFGMKEDCPEYDKEKYKFVYRKDIPLKERYKWRNKKYEDNLVYIRDSYFKK